MNREKERLASMLKDNKITQEDYDLLINALNKKSLFDRISSSLFINPFQKIAGVKALLPGLMILLAMSYAGVIAKVYFPGVMSVLNASVVVDQATKVSFLLLLYQVAVSWLVLSSLFLLAAKLCQQKRMRIIDFFGTVALARYPSLILTALIGAIRLLKPDFLSIDFSKGISMHPSLAMSAFSIVVIGLFVWQITTYFYALKESSGLKGKKLMLSFIVALILGEVIASPLTTIFMN